MNYRHIYHAGNFADVVKHVVLIALLNAFQKKETPFCCLDTHAGIGLYNLHSLQAQKKCEYETGISRLLSLDKKTMPAEIQQYLSLIEPASDCYPGSPWIAKSLLRPQDHLILCELHPEDHQTLKKNIGKQHNIAVHHQDAYLGMKAFLPPKEKRGVVLIDPPFEVTDEFERLAQALKLALKHWRAGCYMIWYPIKDKMAVKHFTKTIAELSVDYLNYHFSIDPSVAKTALSSCGIAILNPPWQLKEKIENTLFPYLATQLMATWR